MPKPPESTVESMYDEPLSDADLDSVVGGLTTPGIKERLRIRNPDESSSRTPADHPASGVPGPLGLRLPLFR